MKSRRWWQYKRTWLIGLPLVLVLGVLGLFGWGSLQPRPDGFALAEIRPSGSGVESASVNEQESAEQIDAAMPVDEGPGVANEVARYTLDARSLEDWVLFDFNTGAVVAGDFSTPGWDVAFRRTKLLTNSGVTNGAGPGGAIDLGEVPLDEVMLPSSEAYVVDILGGEEKDEPENLAAGKWYNYSFISHIVTVKPNAYLFRTGEDRDALVQFDSYYCEDEEPACITFRYRLVPQVGEANS